MSKTKGPAPEKSAVKVMTRVRPFNSRELGDNPSEFPNSVIMMDGNNVHLLNEDGSVKDSFEFHETFWSIPDSQQQFCSKPFADQVAVFEKTGVVAVEAALKGYHCCIFAYGQTGSGKTYTMLGSHNNPGIAPRLVDLLFEEVARVQGKGGYSYTIALSFMEIYNERCKDLLLEDSWKKPEKRKRKSTAKRISTADGKRKSDTSPKNQGRRGTTAGGDDDDDDGEYQDLRVRHSPVHGVFVEGLTKLDHTNGVSTAEDVKRVIEAGMEHRATAETKMNATSSRSHAVFQLNVIANNKSRGVQRYAHINLVDLAGSERIKMSGVAGDRLVEATRINLSLSTLRRVIDILIENSMKKKNQPKAIPPYRDAMLTWVLSESLGGNSKTMMLATVSPHSSNMEDTTNTLRYALKAKAIINTVKVNEEKASVLVSAMQSEIEALRDRLAAGDVDANSFETLKHELECKEAEMSDMGELAQMAAKEILEHQVEIERKKMAIVMKDQEVAELKAERIDEKHELEKSRIKEVEEHHRRNKEAAALVEQEVNEMEMFKKAEMEQKEEQKKMVTEIDVRTKLMSGEHIYTRREEFAKAFNFAFSKTKTSVRLEEIHRELSTLNDATTRAYLEIEKFSKMRAETIRDSSNLRERTQALDSMHGSMTIRLKAETRMADEKIKQLQVEKRVLDEDNMTLVRQYDKKMAQLTSMKDIATRESRARKNSEMSSKQRIDQAKREHQVKGELIEELKRQKQLVEKEVAALQTETTQMKSAGHLMDNNIAERRKEISEITAEYNTHQLSHSLLAESLTIEREILSSLKNELLIRTTTVNGLNEKHKNLKDMVSHRFFPSSSASPGQATVRTTSPSRTLSPPREREWIGDTLHYTSSRTQSPPRKPTASPSPSPGQGVLMSGRRTPPRRSTSPIENSRYNSATMCPPPRYAGKSR
eukprot:TRINITY_DN7196_c0_g3_i1.p1 TRINITY_DN7196_c0_g3~~TRINITY_DN7196_c0_g3_i1.p1  ORF type:complete len:950 (+),score=422.63 TRINITY_DN7196_c0_g3_i1:46-2850(+)